MVKNCHGCSAFASSSMLGSSSSPTSRRNVRIRSKRRPKREPNNDGSQLILSMLPLALLQSILLRVAGEHLRDYCRFKATCKTFFHLMEEHYFYTALDLCQMRSPSPYFAGVSAISVWCFSHGKSSSIFLRGLYLTCKLGDLELGIPLLLESLEMGYELALYAYACLQRLLGPNEKTANFDATFLPLSRDVFQRAKYRFPRLGYRSYGFQFPGILKQKVDEIDVQGLIACKCAPTITWVEPLDEWIKKGNICDSCFWSIQCMWFAGKFPNGVLYWA